MIRLDHGSEAHVETSKNTVVHTRSVGKISVKGVKEKWQNIKSD